MGLLNRIFVFSFKIAVAVMCLWAIFANTHAHAQNDAGEPPATVDDTIATPSDLPNIVKIPNKPFSEDAQQNICDLPQPLCGDKPKFGTYWNSLSDSERRFMLRGFDVGLSAAWQTSYLEGEEAGAIRSSIFDRRLSIGETYAGYGIAPYLDYFNKFYADAVNDTIDWSYAWLLASLAGTADAADQNNHDELYLRKFLQTYGEFPGWVRIVDVKDVNLIEVEVLVPEPYRMVVRLRGVSAKGADGAEMTPEQKDRAMRFIKGLTATRGYPFKNCGCTEMVRPQLFFGGGFFTPDGVMQAYMRINESGFCLIRDEVASQEISRDSLAATGFVLNELLLTSGLAYMDEDFTDYGESDHVMQNVDDARNRGLNLYGKLRNPAIEKIIKQGAKPLNQNCLP